MNYKIIINQLNKRIDECKHEMRDDICYSTLKDITGEMIKRIKIKKNSIYPVKLYSQEQAISMVLNFLESLGIEEWYTSAKNIILGQNKNIGINIFDIDNIKDLNEVDENNLKKYSIESGVYYHGSELEKQDAKANIHISLRINYKDLPKQVLNDNLTLSDIYTIVHEISHTFDMGNTKKSNRKRRLFVENVPFCFERMFGEYLIQNKILDENLIKHMQLERSANSLRHAHQVYTILSLMELKDKEGMLTKNNIDNLLKEKNITDMESVTNTFYDIIDSEPDINYHFTYALSEITSAKFMDQYHHNKKQALSNLQQYCRNMKEGNTSFDTLNLISCPVNYNETIRFINEIAEPKEKQNNKKISIKEILKLDMITGLTTTDISLGRKTIYKILDKIKGIFNIHDKD